MNPDAVNIVLGIGRVLRQPGSLSMQRNRLNKMDH